MIPTRLARFLALLLCGCLEIVSHAQTIISPSVAQVYGGGRVNAIAVQPDGKVVIGGTFDFVHGVARTNIARMNANGTLDAGWNPGVNGPVRALAADASGNVYLAGDFTSAGGQSRNGLAKLSGSTGAADATWNPDPDQRVNTLVIDPGGLYVGGSFQSIGGQTRSGLARLSAVGTGAADAWNPSPDGSFGADVMALALDGMGNAYVGGSFSSMGNETRNGLARVSTAGSGATDSGWDPNPNGDVTALVLDGGNAYVAGSFTTIGGQSRSALAKVSVATGLANATWNPNPQRGSSAGFVNALALDGGNLYVGGDFSSIGSAVRYDLARVSTTGSGSNDGSWSPDPDEFEVLALAVGAGANVYVGGRFTSVGGQAKGSFAALSKASTGVSDTAWPTILAPGSVSVIARDTSGRTVIGGRFIAVGDRTPRSHVARFNADGSLDLTWNPGANSDVMALVLDLSGNVFMGGKFWRVGGLSRNYLAKVSSSGGVVDASWAPSANDYVLALAQDDSGNLYAGGYFATIGGQARSRIAKLAKAGAGAVDPTWNPNATGSGFPTVLALVLDDAGNLYAGGTFGSIGGQSLSNLARLSTTGVGTAGAWNPAPNGTVMDMALDGSGNLFVAGSFYTVGGQARGGVAKVATSGTGLVDPSWNPNASTTSNVWQIKLDGSGSLYAGGPFSSIGGQARNHIAKLSASGTGQADPLWNPDAVGQVPELGLFGYVNALALDGNGNICVGGGFTSLAGQPRLGYGCLASTVAQSAPQITSGNAAIFATQTPGSFTVTATGNPTPTLSMTGALPSGVTFTPATGVLAGTPAVGTVGGYPLNITATNGVAPNATQLLTLTVTATVPGKPTITSVTSGNGQAAVAFSAPGNDGGDPIQFYTARCTSGATLTQTGTSSPITVTGLTNNAQYTCTVSATNGQGEGPQSDPANVIPTNLGSLAFGGQSMGTTSPAKPVGFGLNVPVTVNSVTVSAQYGQTNNCATVPANQTCTIQVTFSPAPVAGAVNASLPVTGTLTITTANAGTFTVALSGIAEKSLVTHYYSAILGRAPDAPGKAFWQAEAGRLVALGGNVNEAWYSMAQQFYFSAEYASRNRTNNGFISDLYVTFFNRAPDTGGLDFWTADLAAGLPREVALAAFMFSQEFKNFTANIFGNTAARAEVDMVMDFYRGLLSRLPDDGGFVAWRNNFRIAQCAATPAAAVNAMVEAISGGIAGSGEYSGKNRTNAQYVGDLYNAFLRRGGDSPGVQSWINFLNNPWPLQDDEVAGTVRERARRYFIKSAEFQGRVTAVVNQGCVPL